MFIDEIKVFARSGHGGKGCVAFHREAFITKGGPSGGNGGRGGNVVLQADHDLNNLIAQYYQPRLLADEGDAGMGKGMDGHAGKDLIVKVPCGTLVWKLARPEPVEERRPAVEEKERPGILPSIGGQRPIIRHSGRERAMEIDLAVEAAPRPALAPNAAGS